MATNTNLFTDKETNNWFKACIALNVTKEGLTNFLNTELQKVHVTVGTSCGNCSIEQLLSCPTHPYCNKKKTNNCSFHKSQKPQQCKTCDKVKQGVILQHRFSGPSWKNTRSENWTRDYWEIGKCFLPPEGYKSISTVQESDFNGVISIMLNCLHFQTCLSSSCLSPPPPDKQCFLEKVRQIGRDVRHTSDCKVTDADLQTYFQTLSTLLADPNCLQHDPSAKIAFKRLIDLQNDRMSIKELEELLKEAYRTLKHAKKLGERFSEDAERTLKTILESKTLLGEKRIESKAQLGEQRIESKTHDAELCIESKTQDGTQRIEYNVQAGIMRIQQAANKIGQEDYERGKADPMDVESDADNNGAATSTKRVLTCALERNAPTGTIHLAVHWKEILGNSKPFKQATPENRLELVEVVNQPQTSTNTQSTTLEQVIIDGTISKATGGQLNDISPTLLIQQTPEDTEANLNEIAIDTQETDTDTEITASPYKLRDYQVELSEHAVNGLNTIICAETGTGKTFVALNIIEQHLADTSKVKHRVVFMARTNVLIQQQFQTLSKLLPMCKIKLISSETEAFTNMAAFLPNNDILCLTPQILLNNIDKGSVQLSDISLLILDECHHTSGNLPYANLGRRYIMEKIKNVKNLPQIVGLTASIGIGKSRTDSEAVDYILKLGALLDCRILSTVQKYENEYMKWCNIPTEERISLVETHIDPCREAVSQAIRKIEYVLEEIAMVQPDLVDLVANNKPHHAKKPAEYIKWALKLQRHAKHNHSTGDDLRNVGSCARYLIIFFSAFEVNQLHQIQHVMRYLAESQKVESQGKDKLTETENDLFNIFKEVQRSLIQIKKRDEDNPNVRTLCTQLGQMLDEKGEDSRAMVFCPSSRNVQSFGRNT